MGTGKFFNITASINKRKIVIVFILLPLLSCKVFQKTTTDLNKTEWIHGSADCSKNTDPPIQVVRLNYNTWILRENKCVNYEAPFMFLFLGHKKALLMDAGATFSESKFPLRQTVDSLVNQWEKANNMQVELVVAHTHSHGDHTAGDIQFKNNPNTTVVGLKVEDIQSFFKIENWPQESSKFDLGDRVMEIIPIPGHHKTSIAVYDNETKILLSGDSFYPGRLYVNDWQAFKASTQRLVDFTAQHKISYLLGNHIEMTNTPGKDYPIGATFQPDEHILPLTVKDLLLLNTTLISLGDKPTRKILDDFIIYPN
ncbi:MAG TPA: MBL fold metallo-hydrolase [Mucilaginibacter sp.]|jgi:hydroxyacylglutathione hydrolase|nr:MBL fold metallo-hydrolase [Mucilaginibacter sp.]